MARYFIFLVLFFTGFVSAVLVGGGNILPYLDLPSFIVVGLFPFLFVSVLFGFREMKAAYATALQKEPEADRVSKALVFFNVYGSAIWVMGMVSVLIGLIGMLRNLEDPSAIGPNMALALLSIHYSGILYLLVVLPFVFILRKKRKAQPMEEDGRAV